MPDVDAVAMKLVPTRIADCGVHTAPAGPMVLLDEPPRWPAMKCVAASIGNGTPFVARYLGLTMDSETETVFAGTRDLVHVIYKDTAGPFMVKTCTRSDAAANDREGVTCSHWTEVRDLRVPDGGHQVRERHGEHRTRRVAPRATAPATGPPKPLPGSAKARAAKRSKPSSRWKHAMSVRSRGCGPEKRW